MQISPRYDADPIIVIDGPVDDQSSTLARQGARLRATLAELTDDQWRTPSRCEGWTVQDVIAHLVGTNDFWRLSITMGLDGTPSRFLASFDPKATPAQMVDAMRSMAPADTLGRFVESNTALCDTLGALDPQGWATIAEAPPGHLPIRLLAHHALWDSWVHERDITLPLGLIPVEESDEILSSLRYAAALSPAFALSTEPDRRGALVLDIADPDARVVVEVDGHVHVHDGPAPDGAVLLKGDAVELLEALSIRRPLTDPVPAESAWLFAGLVDAFS